MKFTRLNMLASQAAFNNAIGRSVIAALDDGTVQGTMYALGYLASDEEFRMRHMPHLIARLQEIARSPYPVDKSRIGGMASYINATALASIEKFPVHSGFWVGRYFVRICPNRLARPMSSSSGLSVDRPRTDDDPSLATFRPFEILEVGTLAEGVRVTIAGQIAAALLGHAIVFPDFDLSKIPDQKLTERANRAFFELAQTSGVVGLRVFYNSFLAGATFPQLHAHLAVTGELPIEKSAPFDKTCPAWPTNYEFTDDPHDAFALVSSLHRTGVPHNVIYTPKGAFVVARRRQNFCASDIVPVPAAMDLAGMFVLGSQPKAPLTEDLLSMILSLLAV